MTMICNQICDWNDPRDGCVKPPAGFCPMSNVSAYQKPMTNADRIRAMTDEELAKHFSGLICDINEGVEYHEAPSRWLEWLKQPAETR